jgi:MFS family permease
MKQRVEVVAAVLAAAFRNTNLRDVGVAYALFSASEFGVWIVLLVFAFDRGGVSAELLITLVQLLPCVVLAPAIGAVADRWDPARALVAGYGIQTVTIGAVAVALALDAPSFVIYLLAPLTALSICMTRPPQSALFPSVVRTPDELTAANVMTGWTEGAAALVGPAIAGVLLTVSGLTAAMAVMAGLNLLSMFLALRVARSLAPITRHLEDDGSVTATATKSFADGMRGNLVGVLMNPAIRVLLILTTFYFVLVGSLDFLCVILALGILHMGPGGAGYLNAAIGAGELVAGFVTAFLIGRRRLVRTLVLSLLGCVCAIALVAVYPRVGIVLVLFVLVGLSGAVYNASGKTLMQRAAPPGAIAGAFSVVESLMCLGLALGAVLIWAGYNVAGIRIALIAPGIAAFVLIAVLWRNLRAIDDNVNVPQVEIRLLRSLRIFAPLPAPTLEIVARELEPINVAAGSRVITEGDSGDQYYAIADGVLEVTRLGGHLRQIGRGDGFGEIALIRDVPRTATVTALTDALIYGLNGDLFVEAVTGNPSASRVAGLVVNDFLQQHPPVPGDSGSEPSSPSP